jgi:hypothetical protein
MLARVLSAALSAVVRPFKTKAEVNGIEVFPVHVEVNCAWGDTMIVIIMSISPILKRDFFRWNARHREPV